MSDSPKLELRWVDPASLGDNPRNWRRHPDSQMAALNDVLADPSIGWAGVLLYNETTGHLIDGHARKQAAIARGDKAVPVVVGKWTEDAEKKILLTLDPIAGMASLDTVQLNTLIDEVELGDAFKDMIDNLADDLEQAQREADGKREIIEDTYADPNTLPPRCNPGDLWRLGDHRLLCGDSTKAEDVARLMDGEKAALCFTSPPYGQQRDYTEEGKAQVSDWDKLMCGVFGNLPMADNGQVLVNLGLIHREGEWLPYWDKWIEWMRQQGWRRFGLYVWDQGPGMMGDWAGRFAPAFELVFHFNRESVKPNKTHECKLAGTINPEKGMRGSDGVVGERSGAGQPIQSHKIPDSVIRVMRHKGALEVGDHPAVFPTALPAEIIAAYTNAGALAYEPFCGSGTTIIAAEQLGRKCYGMEISPTYCDVILARWEKLTGKTAERIA